MSNANSTLAIDALNLRYRYGQHVALDGLTLQVSPNELFALLGPNGSGKTTFFKLLTTLLVPSFSDSDQSSNGTSTSHLKLFGSELPKHSADVRNLLGVVFQHPSCDQKLTVRENLRCQAALFGLRGQQREARIAQVADELGFADRLDWMVEKLSGGLERRVDIAKSMLHAPRLLILDEPSTGLDPAARLDLWHALLRLREVYGVTIVMTTHLLEEAEKAERIGILHAGRMVAVGQPAELRRELGGRVLVIETSQVEPVMQWLAQHSFAAELQSDQVRVSGDRVAELVAPLTLQFGEAIKRLSIAEPSLEDVFIARTGHCFWKREGASDDPAPSSKSRRSDGRRVKARGRS